MRKKRASLSFQTVTYTGLTDFVTKLLATEKEKYAARARRRREEFDRAMDQWNNDVTKEERAALEVAQKQAKFDKEKVGCVFGCDVPSFILYRCIDRFCVKLIVNIFQLRLTPWRSKNGKEGC